jgi:hypothetical protein
VIALPFLLIFGTLFASADPLFNALLDNILQSEKIPQYLGKFIRDFIVFFYFLGAGAAIITRALIARHNEAKEASLPDRTIITTFLAVLNLLFLVFLVFQFAYFFGGEDVVKAYDLSYAEYARQGFYQLVWAAGLVFALAWALYRMTGLAQWLTRELTLLLILQTGVVLVSAVSRLLLYIGAYGLTVSRWWAMAIILLIAAVLIGVLCSAFAKVPYTQWVKATCLAALFAFGGLLLINVEGQVVGENGKRFLSGKTAQLDLIYLTGLSSDAVPALMDIYKQPWQRQPENFNSINGQDARYFLIARLTERKKQLESDVASDWRYAVLSDYRALAALGTR